ncbi:glucose-6-phosphate dehydrogenase [Gonapodya prolifera JEL478]|uniref:Glucose-6-phosphate 1-dehydrogenase n=1 Tax=Gonapodya prolifera (strain JEL478) TaxID=1344416 RepID=A0A139AV23_GONPJ|nr:glucose-6-phosphate dehydrogenase [Gonapodya prolifera JEL478]|eukprot:KXS20549.1 glucose-6-phosphate dehydrogenase [Gonapodya prolifera JEL478]
MSSLPKIPEGVAVNTANNTPRSDQPPSPTSKWNYYVPRRPSYYHIGGTPIPVRSQATAEYSSISDNTTILVLGASGDLAYKKTFPALFGLLKHQFLPHNVQIVGYARSKMEKEQFRERVTSKIKTSSEADKALVGKFKDMLHYVDGQYDKDESYKNLALEVEKLEQGTGKKNRLFYMALPPSVFIPVAKGLRENLYSTTGWNRVVVEKPFGKDLQSSNELGEALARFWKEEEIYRIDHYLGKEMVKNLIVLRFANVFLGSIWNRQFISNVQITFKEPFGTEGRGGYFDEFGIIRDVMQNHLLQVLTIVAMEKPVSLNAEDVRDEKVRVLKYINPLTVDDVLVGQYVKSADGTKPGYKDDKTVPPDSLCPTFAAAVFWINNDRWDGVPFILKCGKALNEAKVEIRIQFNDVAGNTLFPEIARNELVIRVQPDEAVYMKFMNKEPGLNSDPVISELELNYTKRYQSSRIPEAYEALILDVLRGDHQNFVRSDELEVAWKIFTPLLHQLEKQKVRPVPYEYGSRGPEELNDFVEMHGFARSNLPYHWQKS